MSLVTGPKLEDNLARLRAASESTVMFGGHLRCFLQPWAVDVYSTHAQAISEGRCTSGAAEDVIYATAQLSTLEAG